MVSGCTRLGSLTRANVHVPLWICTSDFVNQHWPDVCVKLCCCFFGDTTGSTFEPCCTAASVSVCFPVTVVVLGPGTPPPLPRPDAGRTGEEPPPYCSAKEPPGLYADAVGEIEAPTFCLQGVNSLHCLALRCETRSGLVP